MQFSVTCALLVCPVHLKIERSIYKSFTNRKVGDQRRYMIFIYYVISGHYQLFDKIQSVFI